MTNRMKLFAAVAAVALPAAMAGAQSTAPGGGAHRPTTHATHMTTPRAETPAPAPAPTANTATEDAQDATAQPANAPAAVNQNAEPGTRANAAAQAQIPPAEQAAPAAQAQAATQAPSTAPATARAATANAQAQAAATPPAAALPVRAATAADLHAGVQVRDQSGGVVGTVETADASGAVVSTGTIRARLPLTSFGTNGQALVISMTRGQLEAAATHSQPQPSAG
jgi:hypothetical protein